MPTPFLCGPWILRVLVDREAEGKTHGGKDSVAIWAGIAAGDALAAGVACAAGD